MEDGEDLETILTEMGLDPQWRGRYWFIRCPQHEDGHKSAQCFPDGWIHCHAGCPRIHINKLLKRNVVSYDVETKPKPERHDNDYMREWLELEPLDKGVKGVPPKVLNQAGWRKLNDDDIFIPYFNVQKTKIPFYQIRHTKGERRFSFAKGETPITYGLDVLPRVKKFLFATEGSRDSVILRWAGVDAIALPSASSVKNLKGLEQWCQKNNVILCWCGDRDEAGEKLMRNISIPYIDFRCKYKDIGEMLEAEGIERIRETYATYGSC